MQKLNKKEAVRFYQKMVEIRTVEEKLMEVFFNGEIPGFIHVCIGQEATPVGVCAHLRASDNISTTHRGHGHALAKGMDLKRFMAELFGKKNGPCLGRSGSMHLADSDLGILGANGIVGGGIPIAVGAAFASCYKKSEQVTVCFFGDGATSEGTFHESLNIASLRKLPIVFVCENNGWAEFTPREVHMTVENVADRAEGYNIPGVIANNNFFDIHQAASKAVANARKGKGPTLLEVKSRRWHGHYVGDAQKYRIQDDIAAAKQDDCILDFEKLLLKEGKLRKKDVEAIQGKVAAQVAAAIEFARESPFPEATELMDDLYA